MSKEKLNQLIKCVESRKGTFDKELKDYISFVIKDTKDLVKHGEWYVGFENMDNNLYEVDFKYTEKEEKMVSEILKNQQIYLKKQ